jgi:hypothetical protein
LFVSERFLNAFFDITRISLFIDLQHCILSTAAGVTASPFNLQSLSPGSHVLTAAYFALELDESPYAVVSSTFTVAAPLPTNGVCATFDCGFTHAFKETFATITCAGVVCDVSECCNSNARPLLSA